jgi:hypothetical protein
MAGLELIPGRPDPLKVLSHLCGPLHRVEGPAGEVHNAAGRPGNQACHPLAHSLEEVGFKRKSSTVFRKTNLFRENKYRKFREKNTSQHFCENVSVLTKFCVKLAGRIHFLRLFETMEKQNFGLFTQKLRRKFASLIDNAN